MCYLYGRSVYVWRHWTDSNLLRHSREKQWILVKNEEFHRHLLLLSSSNTRTKYSVKRESPKVRPKWWNLRSPHQALDLWITVCHRRRCHRHNNSHHQRNNRRLRAITRIIMEAATGIARNISTIIIVDNRIIVRFRILAEDPAPCPWRRTISMANACERVSCERLSITIRRLYAH